MSHVFNTQILSLRIWLYTFLSPYLFCIFIANILTSLRNLNVGCFVGSIYYGCIAYADDVMLYAPSLIALRLMLNLYFQFAVTNDILFNPNKFYCVKFCKFTFEVQYTLELQCFRLSWVDKIVHLVHMSCARNKDIQQRLN